MPLCSPEWVYLVPHCEVRVTLDAVTLKVCHLCQHEPGRERGAGRLQVQGDMPQ